MLQLPTRIDANEWYILLNATCGYLWLLFAPRRYPAAVSVLVVLFTVSSAMIFDHVIAGPPLDWYDINDRKGYEITDIFTYFMYAPYALLFVYMYDRLDPRKLWFTAYIVGWSLLCVFFEWLAVKCHVFLFNKWSLVYSFSVYLFMSTIVLKLFDYLIRHFQIAVRRSAAPSPQETD